MRDRWGHGARLMSNLVGRSAQPCRTLQWTTEESEFGPALIFATALLDDVPRAVACLRRAHRMRSKRRLARKEPAPLQ